MKPDDHFCWVCVFFPAQLANSAYQQKTEFGLKPNTRYPSYFKSRQPPSHWGRSRAPPAHGSTPLFPPVRDEARQRAGQHPCRFSLCPVSIEFLAGRKGLFTDSGTSSRERTAKGQASSCDSYLF